MCSPKFLALIVIASSTLMSSVAQAQLYKCINNGSTTYRNTPCPVSEQRRQPTVEQLNAERKKKLARAPEPGNSSKESASEIKPPNRIDSVTTETDKYRSSGNENSSRKLLLKEASFSCDGRKYCSQMSSCNEARYFLSNCPGVKMDGNNDGVPCQEQWCGR